MEIRLHRYGHVPLLSLLLHTYPYTNCTSFSFSLEGEHLALSSASRFLLVFAHPSNSTTTAAVVAAAATRTTNPTQASILSVIVIIIIRRKRSVCFITSEGWVFSTSSSSSAAAGKFDTFASLENLPSLRCLSIVSFRYV